MRAQVCIRHPRRRDSVAANSRSEANEALLNPLAEQRSPRLATHLVAKKKSLLLFFEAEKKFPEEINPAHATTARRGGQRAAVWLPSELPQAAKWLAAVRGAR